MEKEISTINRAYINAIESFALFAPAMILNGLGTSHPAWVATLGWVYVGARLLYTLTYAALGYTIVQSLIWLVQLAAIIGAWAALFLASDESRWITGQSIIANGGARR